MSSSACRSGCDIVKPCSSPSPRSSYHNSSSTSPSSTLSEPTKKPRTRRKRPPHSSSTPPCDLFAEPPELVPSLPELADTAHLMPDELSPVIWKPEELTTWNPSACFDDDDGFHLESMLDDEAADGGIDSIIGCCSFAASNRDGNGEPCRGNARWNPFVESLTALALTERTNEVNLRRAALTRPDDGDWWRSPRVSVGDIAKFAPLAATTPPEKWREVETAAGSSPSTEVSLKPVLGLKLNYDSVLRDWRSGEATPPVIGDPGGVAEKQPNDVLISLRESGGAREASVQRYKEKRQSRLFCKKIRYQVRKTNADGRPRMKGRFVKAPPLPPSFAG